MSFFPAARSSMVCDCSKISDKTALRRGEGAAEIKCRLFISSYLLKTSNMSNYVI